MIDEIDQVEEAPFCTGTNDRRGNANAQMRFAGTGSADEDHVAPCIQERARGEFANPIFINWRVGEDELANILQDRKFGAAHAIADRACLPVSTFGADQAGKKGKDLIAPGKALAGDLIEAGAHAVQLEFSHRLKDLMALHQATFLMLS